MRRRDIVLVCVLLATIVLGMFTYTYLEKQEATETPSRLDSTDNDSKPLVTRIDGKHFYRDGVHTIVGEVMLPTPCDLLTYEAAVQESYPEKVIFDFNVINNTESCAQVVTLQRFLVSATASESAMLTASFAGTPIELNLIEAAANETPDSFELYIKG